MEWISVNDRLPEIKINESDDINDSEDVIALLGNGEVYKMKLSHWYEDRPDVVSWVYCDCGEICTNGATHWMPFVLPNKEST